MANDAAPNVVSVSPSSGTGARQTFTATLNDPDGQADVAGMYFLMNRSFSWPNGWQIAVDRYGGSQILLYLLSDSGNSWLGPITPGGGNLSNSQCTVFGATSSLTSISNTQVQVTLNLLFTASFADIMNVWTCVYDRTGSSSGWVQTGTWNTDPPNGNCYTLTYGGVNNNPNDFGSYAGYYSNIYRLNGNEVFMLVTRAYRAQTPDWFSPQ